MLLRLRHEKRAQQKRIAIALGVDPSFVSQVESGKKPPPNDEHFIDTIAAELRLSAAEKADLEQSRTVERCLGRLAHGASLAQASLGMAVIKNLPNLGPDKIRAIEAILHLENA